MKYSGQKGAVAPFVAILLFVIVISVALVVDLGHVHSVKGQLQKAVDAAALAGARLVPNEAQVTAVASEVARANSLDGTTLAELLDNDPDGQKTRLSVKLGGWDTTALGDDPATRWNPAGEPKQAVKVRAEHFVEPVFFFFPLPGDRRVVADAIALAEPINPVQPLALVSCIPIDEAIRHPTRLPGENPEHIRYFIFDNDTEDSAAWTSLTLDVNASEMGQLLDKNNENNLLFQQIIFGLGLGNNGIENTSPKDIGDCLLRTDNDGTSISCGLGAYDLGSYPYLSPPSLFRTPDAITFPSTPEIIPRNSATLVYQPNSGLDPLVHFRSHSTLRTGYLPRWYNLGDDDEHADIASALPPTLPPDQSGLAPGETIEEAKDLVWTDDYFARLWTFDGLLLQGKNEDPLDYLLRLQGYYKGNAPPTMSPYDNYAFATDELLTAVSNNARDTIISFLYDIAPTQANKKALSDKIDEVEAALAAVDADGNGSPDGDSSIYFPDYLKIAGKAGYPEVGVSNGVIANLMTTFMEKPEVSDGTNLMCGANEPLADEGDTLRIQLPIIFAGFCEEWKALSLPNDVFNLYYIGMSDFLVTRTWNNPDEYDCGANFVNCSDADCPDLPPRTSGDFTRVNIPSVRAIEGLLVPPQLDEDKASSAIRVFLVE